MLPFVGLGILFLLGGENQSDAAIIDISTLALDLLRFSIRIGFGELSMKELLTRLLWALVLVLMAFAFAPFDRAQEARDPEAAAPKPQESSLDLVSGGDPVTQESLAFTGWVARLRGQMVLKDPVAKLNYRLDKQSKIRRFVGRQVRVVGRLGLNSNTIYIESIEPS
ncbi:MAG TPA: hypothetical protein VMG31_02815 [Verrucomicrobiae bacterium]|nr:hypothetical protein [Verrucomicrobiae bacterium]